MMKAAVIVASADRRRRRGTAGNRCEAGDSRVPLPWFIKELGKLLDAADGDLDFLHHAADLADRQRTS